MGGGLAQLEERVVRNDEAPGSKPGFSTNTLLVSFSFSFLFLFLFLFLPFGSGATLRVLCASMAQLAERTAVNR